MRSFRGAGVSPPNPEPMNTGRAKATAVAMDSGQPLRGFRNDARPCLDRAAIYRYGILDRLGPA
jgi:hypothetical protein